MTDTTIERSRFAFDIGTNTLGWAVYVLDAQGRPCELADCGVRLFSDGRNPKDGTSLAMMRRTPRAARRRRDRFIQRRTWLMALLVRHGLMPSDEAARKGLEGLDVYAIRGRALDDRLEPHEIGRALFHMNQRRGYRSNRIADAKADEKDAGLIKGGETELKARLAEEGHETLGQFYAARQAAGKVRDRLPVRVRPSGEGKDKAYAFYPQRDMVEYEFDRIWEAQRVHHPDLMTEEARLAIKGSAVVSDDAWKRMTKDERASAKGAIFYQRPLQVPIIAKCTFPPHQETRLSAAHPVAQRFRIYQELANIKITEGLERPRGLTLEERDLLAEQMLVGTNLKVGKIRKLLDLPGAAKINFERADREELKGDASAARLGGNKGALQTLWPKLSEAQRAETIEMLLTEADMPTLKGWMVSEVGATAEQADDAAKFRPPEGHIRLGITAARRVVEQLKIGDPETGLVITYDEACKRAGYHHSDMRTGEVYDRLPDYRTAMERHTVGGTGNPDDPEDKRLGRVPNPTVHIGLSQLRRVMNALIDRHGPPTEVVLELARELKQTKDDKDKAQKLNRENQRKNEQRTKDLEDAGYVASPSNLRLYRLWEDLGPLPRTCTYTGKTIAFADVFSDRIEIEHILPFSRTLDDSMANKTITFRDINRGKRNQTPEEAFSGPDYEAMQQRADALPRNKAWRFKTGAMEKYNKEERGFLDRQLNETRYLSRLAREYIAPLVNHEEGKNHIWVVTGQLTAMLRARWGLNFSNAKDRNNHRHHAIDAATIGVIDRGLLNEMARRAGTKAEGDRVEEITKDVPQPPGFVAANRIFRDNVRERVFALIVSHKAEHGTGGALHEDTAYGLVDPARGEDGNLVYRKAIDGLTAREVGRIRDLNLRDRLQRHLADKGVKDTDKTGWIAALRAFGQAENIRRVRLLKKEDGVVLIKDRQTGKPYKALVPGENHHMDIVEDAGGVWRGYAATVFEANQKTAEPRWKRDLPGARLVMRVHKGDMVEVDDGGERKIKRVVRINPSERRLYLAGHDEGGELAKRHESPDDHFRWDLASVSRLKERGCRLMKSSVL